MKHCGECGLCCKLLTVPALDKPARTWCHFWDKGCTVYDDRPSECRTFACQWLSDDTLGDEWYPARSKFFVYLDRGVEPNLMRVLVDAGGYGRWRQSPYRERFIRVSAIGLRRAPLFHTLVQFSQRVWLITPLGETEVTGKTYAISPQGVVQTHTFVEEAIAQ